MHNSILRRMTMAMWRLHNKSNMYTYMPPSCQSRCLASYGTIYKYNFYLFLRVFSSASFQNFQCNVIFHSFSHFIYSSLSPCSFFSSGLLLFVSHESWAWACTLVSIFGMKYFVWTIFFLFTFNLVVYLPSKHMKKFHFFTSLETLNLNHAR